MVDRAGARKCLGRGIALTVTKGLPLSGGQGGSAASAVAAAVAVNGLLDGPLNQQELLGASLAAEEIVSGRHADNIAPALFGGIVLIRSLDPIDLVQLPVPRGAARRARAAGPTAPHRGFSRCFAGGGPARSGVASGGTGCGHGSGFGCGDYELLGRAIDDRIAEPVRARLLPGFHEVKAAALEAGALGSSISGSGPTVFALVRGQRSGEQVASAMQAAYAKCGQQSQVRVAEIDREGARVIQPDADRR